MNNSYAIMKDRAFENCKNLLIKNIRNNGAKIRCPRCQTSFLGYDLSVECPKCSNIVEIKLKFENK